MDLSLQPFHYPQKEKSNSIKHLNKKRPPGYGGLFYFTIKREPLISLWYIYFSSAAVSAQNPTAPHLGHFNFLVFGVCAENKKLLSGGLN